MNPHVVALFEEVAKGNPILYQEHNGIWSPIDANEVLASEVMHSPHRWRVRPQSRNVVVLYQHGRPIALATPQQMAGDGFDWRDYMLAEQRGYMLPIQALRESTQALAAGGYTEVMYREMSEVVDG